MSKENFKILIAEDDDIVREVLSSILSKEGYSVCTAKDGLEAIRMLIVEDFHLVITDIKMPQADGITVLKEAIKNNPDCAVVILTAYGSLDSALNAIKEGAFDYLTKPFRIQEVLFVTDKAYKRSLNLEEQRQLKKYLRETYRDLQLIKKVSKNNDPDLIISWIERIDKLVGLNILSPTEGAILKERLVTGDAERESPNSG
ncbi:MAG: response regulator [Thermodesulfovibrionales bacterium]|nr:response regulator [Thermodesulfovibrionales bacterium]